MGAEHVGNVETKYSRPQDTELWCPLSEFLPVCFLRELLRLGHTLLCLLSDTDILEAGCLGCHSRTQPVRPEDSDCVRTSRSSLRGCHVGHIAFRLSYMNVFVVGAHFKSWQVEVKLSGYYEVQGLEEEYLDAHKEDVWSTPIVTSQRSSKL